MSGTAVTVSANATDNVGVVGVQFRLDGANLGPEDTVGPYSVAWNTTITTSRSHTLTAVVRDAAGNTTTSAPVTVIVPAMFSLKGELPSRSRHRGAVAIVIVAARHNPRNSPRSVQNRALIELQGRAKRKGHLHPSARSTDGLDLSY